MMAIVKSEFRFFIQNGVKREWHSILNAQKREWHSILNAQWHYYRQEQGITQSLIIQIHEKLYDEAVTFVTNGDGQEDMVVKKLLNSTSTYNDSCQTVKLHIYLHKTFTKHCT